MKRSLLIWLLLLPLFWASFGMGAQAAGNCSSDPIVTGPISVNGLNFGSIDVLSGLPSETSGSFEFTCNGLNSGQTFRICAAFTGPSPRKMKKDSSTLDYDIFTDSAHSTIYGPAPANGVYFDLTSSKNTAIFNVYALIYGNQNTASVGSYYENASLKLSYALFASGTPLPLGCDPSDSRYTSTSYGFGVGAEITPNCTISATNMTFSPQIIIKTDLLAESALTVKCTNDPTNPILPYISLDNGQYAGSGQRYMQNQDKPGNFISYDLYSNRERTSNWGSSPGVDTVAIERSASDRTVPVYGKIPKPPISPPSGTYTDRITATVNF